MAKLIRDRSTKEKDEWWRSIQEAAKKAPKLTYERSAPMANSEDVLEAARNHTRDFTKFDRAFQEYHLAEAHLIAALAAEVRALREKVAELESDHEWIAERCAARGHRFAYPSNACARCNTKVGSTEPDVYPELCECPRCIVARNVAMDAKREGE